MIVCFILALSYLQTSGGFNVFNFAIVDLTVLNVFSACILWQTMKYLSWKNTGKILVIIVFAAGAVRPIHEIAVHLNQYYLKPNYIAVTKEERDLYSIIERETPQKSIVQTHPYHSTERETPYVAYWTGRYAYLSGLGMLESHNQPVQSRKELLRNAFQQRNERLFVELIKEMEINYLLILNKPNQGLPFPKEKIHYLTIVFQNDTGTIYKVPESLPDRKNDVYYLELLKAE
jgi:hypothetical protein